MAERLPLKFKLLYSIGQFGWSLCMGIISTWLIWYYNPPTEADLPVLIPQQPVLVVFTLVGIISMLGRFLDAVTDPLIANWSDRSTSKLGRRTKFMRIGAIPTALFLVLVFVNPNSFPSAANVLFLTAMLFLFYFFLTMYVTPYFALVAEYGHTVKEKLDLSTYISLTWFLGFAIAANASGIWNIFIDSGMERIAAIRLTIAILGGLGAIMMILPALIIPEMKYSTGRPANFHIWKSLVATIKNKNFRAFIYSDFIYWFSLTMWSTGVIYFVTVLLQLPEETNGLVVTINGVVSFLFYPLVNILAKKLGKKKLMNIAYILFVIALTYCGLLGSLPISKEIQSYGIILFVAPPLAIFGILPNAIIADLAESDGRVTGDYREAMYFGSRTFVQKLGQSVGLLVFSSLLLLGKEVENPMGIRLAAFSAAVLMFISLLNFLRYKEKDVLAILNEDEPQEIKQ